MPNKKINFIFLAAFINFFSLSCGKITPPNLPGAVSGPAANAETSETNGDWESGCLNILTISFKSFYKFAGNTLTTRTATYGVRDCVASETSFTRTHMTIESLGDSSPLATDSKKMDLVVVDAMDCNSRGCSLSTEDQNKRQKCIYKISERRLKIRCSSLKTTVAEGDRPTNYVDSALSELRKQDKKMTR